MGTVKFTHPKVQEPAGNPATSSLPIKVDAVTVPSTAVMVRQLILLPTGSGVMQDEATTGRLIFVYVG